jgi:hypothetical protein
MARKPNYQFERRERERVKAAKKAAKAELKRRKTEDAAGGRCWADRKPGRVTACNGATTRM